MTENKEKNVMRFPDCDCNEDCLHNQGTSKNIQAIVTYVLLKRFVLLQWRWPGKSCGAFAFSLNFLLLFLSREKVYKATCT